MAEVGGLQILPPILSSLPDNGSVVPSGCSFSSRVSSWTVIPPPWVETYRSSPSPRSQRPLSVPFHSIGVPSLSLSLSRQLWLPAAVRLLTHRAGKALAIAEGVVALHSTIKCKKRQLTSDSRRFKFAFINLLGSTTFTRRRPFMDNETSFLCMFEGGFDQPPS